MKMSLLSCAIIKINDHLPWNIIIVVFWTRTRAHVKKYRITSMPNSTCKSRQEGPGWPSSNRRAELTLFMLLHNYYYSRLSYYYYGQPG